MLVSDILMKIDRRSGSDGCWRYAKHDSYPTFYIFGKFVKGHRFMWSMRNGQIPNGKVICHKCDIRWCINPDHLFCGTQKDNVADARQKGRLKGSRGKTKTKESLVEIRGFVPVSLDEQIKEAAQQNDRTKAAETRMLIRLGLKSRQEAKMPRAGESPAS